MKKLYTLATLAVLGWTAAVATPRQQATDLKITTNNAESAEKSIDSKLSATKALKAPAKVAAISELNGVYDWSYLNLLEGVGSNPELTITITDEATGAAKISGLPQSFVLDATVDIEAGTLTIPNKQALGADSYGDQNFFYLKPVENNNIGDGASDAAATVGYIMGNTITFPTLDVWAIGDPNAEELGWWILTYANELSLQTEKVQYGETATVKGDMFFSAFGVTPASYKVDVYYDGVNEVKLIVVDAIRGLYDALGWTTSSSPTMYIDATDPDNILIEPFSLGIDGGDEHGIYYGLSNSANYEDLSQTPSNYRITLSKTEESAVITFPYRSLYLWPSNTTSLYYANTLSVTITIPLNTGAVEDITVIENTENAPAEYFNLQGARISNPAAGQLLIKKQGNTISKVLVK